MFCGKRLTYHETKIILSDDDALIDGGPLPKECRHDYQLYNNQPGEWKLIWECRKCGVLCVCKCFKNAMEKMTMAEGTLDFPTEHDVEWLADEKGVSIEEMTRTLEGLDYCGMACELCLDRPSTHSYSDDIASKDEFERRYGAYILRDAIVLASSNDASLSAEGLWEKAAEDLRELYGFRPRDEVDVDNDKLHEIVGGLFPDHAVLRSHEPDWLPGDVLEVFIPDIGIAIEHRGMGHYETFDGNRIDDLLSTKERDDCRERACIENGVSLIVFPYFIALDRDTVGWKIAEARSLK